MPEQLSLGLFEAPTEKVCKNCGESKPLSGFARNRGMRDGRLNMCLACQKLYNDEYRRLNHESLTAKRLAYESEHRAEINAKMRVYMAEYRKKPSYKQKQLAAGVRFRKRNLAKFAAKEARRRDRTRGNGGGISPRDWFRLTLRYGGLCAYCGVRPGTTRDHIIPIARGGSSNIGNILPACLTCNCTKRHMLQVEWRYGRKVPLPSKQRAMAQSAKV